MVSVTRTFQSVCTSVFNITHFRCVLKSSPLDLKSLQRIRQIFILTECELKSRWKRLHCNFANALSTKSKDIVESAVVVRNSLVWIFVVLALRHVNLQIRNATISGRKYHRFVVAVVTEFETPACNGWYCAQMTVLGLDVIDDCSKHPIYIYVDGYMGLRTANWMTTTLFWFLTAYHNYHAES